MKKTWVCYKCGAKSSGISLKCHKCSAPRPRFVALNLGSWLSKWGLLAMGVLMLSIGGLYELSVNQRPKTVAEIKSSECNLRSTTYARGPRAGWYKRSTYRYEVDGKYYEIVEVYDGEGEYRNKSEAEMFIPVPSHITVAYSRSNPGRSAVINGKGVQVWSALLFAFGTLTSLLGGGWVWMLRAFD